MDVTIGNLIFNYLKVIEYTEFIYFLNKLAIGNKRPLTEEDLYNPLPDEQTQYYSERLGKEWDKELDKLKKKQKPSFAKAFFRAHWVRLVINCLYMFIEVYIIIKYLKFMILT